MPDFSTKRCFVAIWPDDIARADLDDLMRDVDIPGVRVTPTEQRHITLKFLGDIEDPDIPAVIDAMRDAAAGVEPFDVDLTGVAYLPDVRRPRVLVAEVAPCDGLQRLFQRFEDASAAIGFRREGRPFRPHITLGRFRKRRGKPRGRRRPEAHAEPPPAAAFDPLESGFRVKNVCLVQSTLDTTGPTYTPLAEAPLQA